MKFRLAALSALPLLATNLRAESLGEFIMHHMANSDHFKPWPFLPAGLTFPTGWKVGPVDLSISQHVFMMLLAAALMLILFTLGARRKAGAPASRWGHALEATVIYIRDEVVVPTMGREDGEKWLPFFLTLFFYILSFNLLGLIPGFPSVGSNINVTAAMAILVFILYNVAGMVKNGPVHYFTNLFPKGVPWPVMIIIIPIEIMGLFTKAFALSVRLFANMSAGHILILSLLGLIAVFKSWILVTPFLGFTLFIYLIEVLVAFLQAYVFTLLSSLFVGMALHQEH